MKTTTFLPSFPGFDYNSACIDWFSEIFSSNKMNPMKKLSLRNWSEKMASPVTGGKQHVVTPFGKGVSWDTFQTGLNRDIKLQVQRIDDPNLLIYRNPQIAPELQNRQLIPLKDDLAAIRLARRYGITCTDNGIVF